MIYSYFANFSKQRQLGKKREKENAFYTSFVCTKQGTADINSEEILVRVNNIQRLVLFFFLSFRFAFHVCGLNARISLNFISFMWKKTF